MPHSKILTAIAGCCRKSQRDSPDAWTSNETKFASVADLASAMRRAETAHGEYEKRALAGVRDANWSDWYAEYIAAEQSGRELPQ